jgi:hypothetical protein
MNFIHIISFIPFHRSIQDYKIHMDMEIVIFLQVMLYNHKSIKQLHGAQYMAFTHYGLFSIIYYKIVACLK